MERTADSHSDSPHTADGRPPLVQRVPEPEAAVILTPEDSGGWQPGLPGWRPDRSPDSPTTTSLTLTRTGGPARSTGRT
jgi:hypothetical protein